MSLYEVWDANYTLRGFRLYLSRKACELARLYAWNQNYFLYGACAMRIYNWCFNTCISKLYSPHIKLTNTARDIKTWHFFRKYEVPDLKDTVEIRNWFPTPLFQWYTVRFNKHVTSLTTSDGRHLSENTKFKRWPEFKTKYFMRISWQLFWIYIPLFFSNQWKRK